MDERPLRQGLIGCGRVAERFHLPALRTMATWPVVGAEGDGTRG